LVYKFAIIFFVFQTLSTTVENVGAALVAAYGKHKKIFITRGRPQGRPLHL